MRLLGLAVVLCVACGVAVILSPGAAADRIVNEEWLIPAGETEVVENETLALMASVVVNGTLEVRNSSLVLAASNFAYPSIRVGPEGALHLQDLNITNPRVVFSTYTWFTIVINATGSLTMENVNFNVSSYYGNYVGINGEGGLPEVGLANLTFNHHGASDNIPAKGQLMFLGVNVTLTGSDFTETSLFVTSGSLVLNNVTISNSITAGIVATDSQLTIMNSTISDCIWGGISAVESNVVLDNVTLAANNQFGFTGTNVTLTQRNVNYTLPDGTGANAAGSWTIYHNVPVVVRVDGERVEATLTGSDGPNQGPHHIDTDADGNTMHLWEVAMGVPEPWEPFPVTLNFEANLQYNDLENQTMYYFDVGFPDEVVLDGVPEAPLEVDLALDLDFEIVAVEWPAEIVENDYAKINVTIHNHGNCSVDNLRVVVFDGYQSYWIQRESIEANGTTEFVLQVRLTNGTHDLTIVVGDGLEHFGVETPTVTRAVEVEPYSTSISSGDFDESWGISLSLAQLMASGLLLNAGAVAGGYWLLRRRAMAPEALGELPVEPSATGLDDEET